MFQDQIDSYSKIFVDEYYAITMLEYIRECLYALLPRKLQGTRNSLQTINNNSNSSIITYNSASVYRSQLIHLLS